MRRAHYGRGRVHARRIVARVVRVLPPARPLPNRCDSCRLGLDLRDRRGLIGASSGIGHDHRQPGAAQLFRADHLRHHRDRRDRTHLDFLFKWANGACFRGAWHEPPDVPRRGCPSGTAPRRRRAWGTFERGARMSKLAIRVSRTFPGVRGAPALALQPTLQSRTTTSSRSSDRQAAASRRCAHRAGLDTPPPGAWCSTARPWLRRRRSRHGLSVVYAVPWLTVRENICFGLVSRCRKRSRRDRRALYRPRRACRVRAPYRSALRRHGSARDARALVTTRRSCCSTSPSARSTARHAR